MVVAQPLVYAPDRCNTLINALLIIEILSPSTAADDRGTKFALYRTIASFQEYVLVEQARIYLEQYTKTNDRQWLLTPYSATDTPLALRSLNLEIAIADIYDKVTIATPTPPSNVISSVGAVQLPRFQIYRSAPESIKAAVQEPMSEGTVLGELSYGTSI